MGFPNYKGSLVGGDFKGFSELRSNKTTLQDTYTTGCRTAIVELYLINNNAATGLGLKKSDSTMVHTGTDYSTYDWTKYDSMLNALRVQEGYDFESQSRDSKMYVSHNLGGSPRKVFALHSKSSNINLYPAHLFNISYGSGYESRAYIGFTIKGMNEWVTHTAGNGRIYMSITVNSNNKFICEQLHLTKGNKYTFNMHTVSEAGCDGIIISTSQLSNSVSVSNGGDARCSGVDIYQTYTYTPNSNDYINIYFKTNASYLENSSVTSSGNVITEGFTTGDIEIIVEPITTTITLNLNGGTSSGTTSIEIPYGTDMSTISITPPTGKPYCTFAGYYTGSSRNSPGKKYIDSNGKGVNGLTWDIVSGSVTLYALYNYSRALVKSWYPLHCIYCTTNPISSSTLDSNCSITLGEIEILFIEGTLSCEEYNISSGNHLSNLNIYNNTTLVIPEGSASGDYKFGIKYKFTPSDTSVFIKEETQECQIWITPTYIVDETMELPSPVPDSLVQWKDIPACGVTLDTNNLSEYFKINNTTNTPIPSTSTLIYNNGKTESSTPQITWSISNPITFNSLGTEIKSRQQVDIDNSNICMIVPKRFYDGNYYSNSKAVIEIVSRHVSSGVVVSYFSRFSDLGVNNSLNNYGLNNVNIIKDLEEGYSITINRTALKDIYSVDLLCKFLHDLYRKGGISTNSGYSMLVSASYNSTQVYREANEVTNLHISVTDNPIYAGETTTWNTKADFTSGDSANVNGLETFSGYNTSIIRIDNK